MRRSLLPTGRHFAHCRFAQAPTKNWEEEFGGSDDDEEGEEDMDDPESSGDSDAGLATQEGLTTVAKPIAKRGLTLSCTICSTTSQAEPHASGTPVRRLGRLWLHVSGSAAGRTTEWVSPLMCNSSVVCSV